MDYSSGDEIEVCQKVEPHEDDETVKSKAVVKFESVQAPAKFTRLQCKTDLNLPPSNWLCNSANIYGIPQLLQSSVGFASFNMAHRFSDCLEDVDVVSDAENIKKLLKLPYSRQSAVSMMVHNIGNTLLIDEFDIQKYLLRKVDDNEWNWLRTFINENILNHLGDKTRNVCLKDKSREAINQKNLLSKFLYYTLQKSTFETTDNVQTSITESRPLPLLGPILPEPNIGENVPDPNSNHVFNRNIVWTFEDIRMLIGTDMPIFGGGTRPCISLKLRDMTKPINVLTGIDYWLDNLMCNVPEVVMCYHLDGIVQKYELIKTEDLPYLEDSTFSPQVIRNVAQNILAFLKSNATKAGHTYWLFKGKNDDVVKLYDLTTLCKHTRTSAAEEEEEEEATASTSNNSKNDNPFTVPVAMLLYTVARNIKNTSEKMSAKKAGSIKALLENCIKLLPKEKYPQIVTSSHYILSDLHIPAGIDPKSPIIYDNSDLESDNQSIYDDEFNFQQYDDYDVDKNNGEYSSNFSLINDNFNENVAVQSICDTLKEFKLVDKNLVNRNNRPPSPLQASIEDRCTISLTHITKGLNCLQYFAINEEQITAEMAEREKEEEKRKILHEEQNPTMAKSFQPIPLPYGSLKPNNTAKEATKINSDKAIPMGWHEKPTEKIEVTKNKNKKHKSKQKRNQGNCAVEGTQIAKNSKEKYLVPTAKTTKIFGSWNVHLKLLLIEKACLTYATLAEYNYEMERYGVSLRAINLAFGCQKVVTKFMDFGKSQKSCLLGRAGDCLFQIVKNFSNIEKYLEQFENFKYENKTILEELEKDLDDFSNKLFLPIKNIPELMLLSCQCYELALEASDNSESRLEIIRRLGSVRNELGVKYMFCAQEEYNKYMENEVPNEKSKLEKEPTDGDENLPEMSSSNEPIYQSLTMKAYDHLIRGISAFEEVHDHVNLAFLLCNMGRFMRFRAHIHLKGEEPNDLRSQKRFYNQAFSYYQRALGILENRKQNPELWDLVNWELSTATFTLAKQIQDFSNKVETSSEEVEKEVIDLLQKSLKLCDVEHSSSRKILYTYRAGLIHNRLASFYHSQYRKVMLATVSGYSDDFPASSKTNLQLCRLHYEKSAKILENLKEVKDCLVVQLERIALQELLAEVGKTTQKFKALQSGLEICLQTKAIILHISKNNLENTTSAEIMKLLKLFESRLQFLLKTLTKQSITMKMICGKNQSKPTDMYKMMYSSSISTTTYDNEIEMANHLVSVLDKISLIKNSN